MYIRAIKKDEILQEKREVYLPLQEAIIEKLTFVDWSSQPIYSLKKEQEFISMRLRNHLAVILTAALYAKVWKSNINHVLENMLFSWEDLLK